MGCGKGVKQASIRDKVLLSGVILTWAGCLFTLWGLSTLQRGDTVSQVVAIAQLVEHRIVVPRVVGSSPISHPIRLRFLNWSKTNLKSLRRMSAGVPPSGGRRRTVSSTEMSS